MRLQIEQIQRDAAANRDGGTGPREAARSVLMEGARDGGVVDGYDVVQGGVRGAIGPKTVMVEHAII